MRILNFGSLNIDYTYQVNHIVAPGETISSKSLQVFPGGKGLNQSIALARAGADVYHAGLIGEDGMFLRQVCEESGVNTQFVGTSKVRTGNAIIQVADNGQNCIILFPGANREQSHVWIEEVLSDFGEGDTLLLQNEINMVDYLIKAAYKKKMKIVLNPSPYDEHLHKCDLKKVDVFLMNEVEGEQITGKSKWQDIIEEMKLQYPKAGVVLTLGELGSVYADKEKVYRQECVKVQAVDTTAAGDTFTGYFIAGMAVGQNIESTMKESAAASALAVTKKGAVSSIPNKKEVQDFLK